MLTTKRILIASLLSAVVVGTSCISLAKTNAKPADSSTPWRSNPAYAKQLAAPVKVDGFYVSPPAGYVLEHKQHRTNVNIIDQYDWRGANPPGTKSRFTVAVFNLLPGVVNTRNAEESLDNDLNAMHSGKTPYLHTDIQHGKVGSINFVRSYWKRDPNDVAEGKMFHGFSYEYLEGDTNIRIIGEDVEPYHKSTLDLMEASALTFHK